jgi:hypothetical protein
MLTMTRSVKQEPAHKIGVLGCSPVRESPSAGRALQDPRDPGAEARVRQALLYKEFGERDKA